MKKKNLHLVCDFYDGEVLIGPSSECDLGSAFVLKGRKENVCAVLSFQDRFSRLCVQ